MVSPTSVFEVLGNGVVALTSDSNTIASGRRVTLVVPGSTSNLGPGLDTIGLALNIRSKMTFHVAEESEAANMPFVKLSGAIRKSQPEDQGKLVYKILSKIWEHDNDLLKRVRITVQSDIPLGCGLGSSASSILGALWASSVFCDKIPTAQTLLAEGCVLEGHPETLAASLYGGMVVCAPSVNGNRIITQQIAWPDDWHILAVVPDYTLHTADLRAALPKQVKLEDAIFNAQRVGLLVAAVTRSDESAMKEALNDRLHEQYREKFVPELKQLRRELVNDPVIGCVLSGAGSSCVIIVKSKKKEQVKERLEHFAQSAEKPHRILDLQVSKEGMQELEI